MATSMMQDFLTFAQSIGQASDSLVQLRNTRVALAQDAIATKITARNADFLKRLYLPDGDNRKITPQNWRESLVQYENETEQIMGTVKDEGIQQAVRAQLMPGNEQFIVELSSKLYEQEQAYARSEYGAIRAEVMASSLSEEQKIASITGLDQKYSNSFAFTPEEKKQHEFDLRGLQATADARKELESGLTPKAAKEKVLADKSKPTLERDSMLGYYDSVQASMDADAEEDWKVLFLEPSKTWQVDYYGAEEQIAAWEKQGVSADKLAMYSQQLYSYRGGVLGQGMTDTVDAALTAAGGSFSQRQADELLKMVNSMPTDGNKVAEEQQTVEINRIKSSIAEDGASAEDKEILASLDVLKWQASTDPDRYLRQYQDAVLGALTTKPQLVSQVGSHVDFLIGKGWMDKNVAKAMSSDTVLALTKRIVAQSSLFQLDRKAKKLLGAMQKKGYSSKDAAMEAIAADIYHSIYEMSKAGKFISEAQVEKEVTDQLLSIAGAVEPFSGDYSEGVGSTKRTKEVASFLKELEGGTYRNMFARMPGDRAPISPASLAIPLEAVDQVGKATIAEYITYGLIPGVSSMTQLTPAIQFGDPSFIDMKGGFLYDMTTNEEGTEIFFKQYEYKDGNIIGTGTIIKPKPKAKPWKMDESAADKQFSGETWESQVGQYPMP